MDQRGGFHEEEEAALVDRAAAGDRAAFESLYRRHVGRVYALCLRLSGKKDMAEELTQEVFVKTWEKLHTFRGESAFSSWLHRLTVNVVLGEWRTRYRHQAAVVAMDDASLFAKEASKNAAGVGMDLERAVAMLPLGARTVFVLHDIEGYGHEEIGSLSGIAPGTSKAQLHSARKKLREMLKK